MSKQAVKENAQALLKLAERLVRTPGTTWIDANNAIFSPGGPYARLFRTKAARVAFGKMEESRQIRELILTLPEPPVRRASKEEYQGARTIQIIDIPTPRRRAKSRRQKATARS